MALAGAGWLVGLAVVIASWLCVLHVPAARTSRSSQGVDQAISTGQHQCHPTLVAIPDVHGDLHNAKAALQLAEVLDGRGLSWTGNNSLLVQMGDLVDRGPQGVAATFFFENLKKQAEESGGSVTTLMGNHEVMQLMGDLRYVSMAETAMLGSSTEPGVGAVDEASANAVKLPAQCSNCAPGAHRTDACWTAPDCAVITATGKAVLQQMLSEDQPYGKALRSKPVAAIRGTGNCTTLFVHAGLTTAMLQSVLGRQESKAEALADPIANFNAVMTGMIHECSKPAALGCMSGQQHAQQQQLLHSASRSPLWYRGLAMDREKHVCQTVRDVLALLGAERMVVGHTVMTDKRMHMRCNGRLHLIDVGMCGSYSDTWAAWTCQCGQVVAKYRDGSIQALPLTDIPLATA